MALSRSMVAVLEKHPNDIIRTGDVPPEWTHWWSWCQASETESTEPRWLHLVTAGYPLPDQLVTILDSVRRSQFSRQPVHIPVCHALHHHLLGMSPKKAHEVQRMAAFLASILDTLAVARVVDVGAGQAYLSRFLASHVPGLHILALDSNEAQTRGAERWSNKRTTTTNSTITYKTIHITPESLFIAIDEWIRRDLDRPTTTTPVLIVALHACGSLTPDMLRFFLQHCRTSAPWTPRGLVTVGCCYNLMTPNDFPLSREFSATPSLPTSAFHLATQHPAQWLSSPESQSSAALSIRKVVWRALLIRCLPPEHQADNDTGTTGLLPANKRLGRLPDKAYTDWPTFLQAASNRLGIPIAGPKPTRAEEAPLEVLHVLRCLIGPCVESVIIKDRLSFVRETLADMGCADEFTVEMVNLFDQNEGSARNVAIVIIPV